MKRKHVKLGGLLLAIILGLSSMSVALAVKSSESMEIDPTTNTFTYALYFDAITDAYASAQFDITISDKNTLDITDIAFDSTILESTSDGGGTIDTLESIGDVVDKVVYQAGFFSPENQFSGAMPVCTITFVYHGSDDATVTFDNLKVTRTTDEVVDGLPVVTEQTFTSDDWSRTLDIARTGSDATPAPGDGAGGEDEGILGETTINFDDVHEGDWFYDAVQYVVNAELFNGTSETMFSPETAMTRAMFASILYRLEGKPAVTAENTFDDVPDGEYYTDAIVWAYTNAIVKGYDISSYGTSDGLTREQLVTMLYRYAAYKGYDITIGQDETLQTFTDVSMIDSYAVAAFQWAYASDVIHGRTTTTLVPQDLATRAECAEIMMNFIASFVA